MQVLYCVHYKMASCHDTRIKDTDTMRLPVTFYEALETESFNTRHFVLLLTELLTSYKQESVTCHV